VNESDALRAAVGAVTRAPAAVLPFYLVVAGVAAAARVPVTAALALALGTLVASGRLAPVLRRLADLDPADPAAAEEAARAVAGLATPTVAVTLAAGAGAGGVVYLLLRGPAAAGTFHAVWALLEGRPPAGAGVAGVATDWRTFLGLRLLRTGLAVPAVALVVAGVGVLGVGPAGALAGVVLVSLGGALLVGATLALAFTGPAVVVDGLGPAGAVRRSVGLVGRRPAVVLAYAVVLLVVAVGGSGVALALAAAGVPRVAGLLATLAVPPVLDGFKTALYADRGLPVRSRGDGNAGRGRGTAREGEPTAPAPAGGTSPRAGLARLVAFVRDHPVPNLASLGAFAGAAVLAYAVVAGFGVRVDTPGAGEPFGPVPVAAFLDIAANNWLVAATGAYGGLAAGVPALATLTVNGALVGAVSAVVPVRAVVGFVVPHAVVELPALVVGGGLGLHLGRVGVRAARGDASAAAVGAELSDAFRVLVGLAVLFVVAAAIEAFLTPRIGAALLG
jgi:hypothetical protein